MHMETVPPDVLTPYNGQNFTHDANGNPLSYRDDMSFIWQGGRHLAAESLPEMSIDYTCDDNGVRTSKTVNGVTILYTSMDGRITGQRDSENVNEFMFVYDRHDHLIGFRWNGDHYLYVRNLQGDITEILDMNGKSMVKYNYNPCRVCTIYGNLTLGNLNPMRYRGYYYDTETGLYLAGTRYYDPVIGRFLNEDEPLELGRESVNPNQHNLFCYCWNNPANMMDKNGSYPEEIKKIEQVLSELTDAEEIAVLNDLRGAWQIYTARERTFNWEYLFYPDLCGVDSTKANAFRHACWNAFATFKIGYDRTKKFTDAHEDREPDPTVSAEINAEIKKWT